MTVWAMLMVRRDFLSGYSAVRCVKITQTPEFDRSRNKRVGCKDYPIVNLPNVGYIMADSGQMKAIDDCVEFCIVRAISERSARQQIVAAESLRLKSAIARIIYRGRGKEWGAK